jgi:multidrug resistance protein, MATE family
VFVGPSHILNKQHWRWLFVIATRDTDIEIKSMSTSRSDDEASPKAIPIRSSARSLPSEDDALVFGGEEDAAFGGQLSRSFTRGFRRPSVPTGTHPLHLSAGQDSNYVEPSPEERKKLIKQEKGLLKDSGLYPSSKHRGVSSSGGPSSRLQAAAHSGLRKVDSSADADLEQGEGPNETTGLLSGGSGASYQATDGGRPTADEIDRQFEQAVIAGLIKTSWKREVKVLTRSSAPLILTFILQYSLHMTSIFTVGHIGTSELGAVSLGSMTAAITGWSVFQGCATALDTLCSQAYGAGNKALVGLHLQRMVWFLFCILVPIGIVWLNSAYLLSLIVPERHTAELAGLYLRVILCGAPGYIVYECGKRYMMCQGMFDPILYVLLVCAPINVFLNWLFVWVRTRLPLIQL